MDNNFSAQVKEIISFSREEALRLGNDFIGTEHLLLGLIRKGIIRLSGFLKVLTLISMSFAKRLNWR
jgi:ATP-dependent Clp protease ATP-binding subunit ClpC